MEMKHETKIGIICVVVCALLLLVAFYVIRYEDLKAQRTANASSNIEGTDSDDRFEIEYTQRISNYEYLIVVTDRTTDVQYLITRSTEGIGVTTMRDTNGMVLLRE